MGRIFASIIISGWSIPALDGGRLAPNGATPIRMFDI